MVESHAPRRRRLDRQASSGPSLTIADRLAVDLGNAEGEARIGELACPVVGRELGEEGREIFARGRDAPNVSQKLVRKPVDRRQRRSAVASR